MKEVSLFYKITKTICLTNILAIVFMVAAGFTAVQAQTTFGRISGTVTDANGAAIANATVTVTDSATNFSRTATSDESGFYTVTNLPVGTYDVLVERKDFKKSIRQRNVVNADARLTIDFAMETGQITETVEVTQESGETVNTTSGEVAKVIDNQQIDNLALNGRNYYQLMSVIPGAVTTADDSLDTNLATNTINISGNRGVSNNLTIDGGNNNNAGSNASQINNVGLDFIQEVKLQTSNFSAEYGRNSGAQINVITKRGTNKYHGSLFEFLRNDRFDARDAFAATKPFLRYHNYGWTFGGPLPFFNFGEGGPMFKSGKDKFFFFAGQEWKSIHRFGASNRQTLPTTAELNGDFSFRLRGADGIVGTADDGVIKDPLVAGTCTAANRTACFGGNDVNLRNKIPLNRITADGLAIANVYRTMISLASGYSDTPTGQNATFQPPIASDFRQEFLRLDYIFNPNHSIYGRYVHDTNVVVEPYGTFINSPLPTSQQLRNRPGNGFQFGYIWNIKPTLINEFKFNASWTDQRIVPNTPYSERSTYGFNFNQLFANGGQYENSIPNVSVNGFASFSGVAASLTALARDYMLMDNITWVSGNHTFKFGGLFNFSQIYQNGRSLYAGNVAFNNSQNTNTTGNSLADALLGNFRTYSEASLDPASRFRFQQYEAFGLDSWRVSRKLSLELGVRWQYGTPFYAAENTITNFDPKLYDPSKAVTLTNNGANVVVNAGQNRFNGLVRPDGTTLDIYQNNANVLSVPATAPRGFYKPKNYFMPRVGFAYSPFDDSKTSIRGGFGMYYDRIEGNIIFPLENNPPYVNSASYENGNLSNISGGSASALTPFANITTISPDMKTSYTMNFSLGVQRELPWGLFVEANGVGNLGRNLTRQIDLNAAPLALQLANPGVNTALLRPYKGFTGILQRVSDASSHYYAMQFYGGKRKGNVLATVSYTWSKVLSDANVLTEQAEEGLYNRAFNFGPATFDRRHVFVATYTYSLPLFRKTTGWVKAVLDGYEISGITRIQAGKPYTITGAASIGGTRRADIVNDSIDLYIRDNRQWLNPAAFAAAPGSRLGTSGVGIVTGPILAVNDFSVRKRFRLGEKKDLRLQADVFNAFNRNNFSNMQTVVTNASFGTLTVSGPGRSIQLGIKFGF
ncbi:MAG: TonB-dependent receptor [Pyrinomonadaceae bacterium]|nr:TonB-dependent receptor [Pyrinomonadaceae bacterium]